MDNDIKETEKKEPKYLPFDNPPAYLRQIQESRKEQSSFVKILVLMIIIFYFFLSLLVY